MNYNLCVQMGRLTRDVELTYTAGGVAVAAFGIANNYQWVKDGEKKEDVMFIDCVCFGKRAEAIKKFFSKGKPILIQGRLQLDQWVDANQQKHSKHKLVVADFTFVETKAQAAPGATNEPQQAPQPPYDPNRLYDPDDSVPF